MWAYQEGCLKGRQSNAHSLKWPWHVGGRVSKESRWARRSAPSPLIYMLNSCVSLKSMFLKYISTVLRLFWSFLKIILWLLLIWWAGPGLPIKEYVVVSGWLLLERAVWPKYRRHKFAWRQLHRMGAPETLSPLASQASLDLTAKDSSWCTCGSLQFILEASFAILVSVYLFFWPVPTVLKTPSPSRSSLPGAGEG